jgi:glucokinase
MMRVLAIDIGGTKSSVGLCELNGGVVTSVTGLANFISRNYRSMLDMIYDWNKSHPGIEFDGVGAGVAGPVVNKKVYLTNLGWDIDEGAISAALGKSVRVCNDMEAHGWGILGLTAGQIVSLNMGSQGAGAKALIAAGTGLGESVIGWNGVRHAPMAGEGGHSSFSPTNELEDLLLIFLRKELGGHVSWERVLGGLDGFRYLTKFLAASRGVSLPPFAAGLAAEQLDWGAATISAAEGGDAFANEILALYARLYGREAGNLALKCVPRGGVYLGGGIAPRILPWLSKYFMEGFTDKGRFASLLSGLPVHVIMDGLNGLKGAALQDYS